MVALMMSVMDRYRMGPLRSGHPQIQMAYATRRRPADGAALRIRSIQNIWGVLWWIWGEIAGVTLDGKERFCADRSGRRDHVVPAAIDRFRSSVLGLKVFFFPLGWLFWLGE